MANLFFPQMPSGAMVQYPVRKVKQFRSVNNVYADGSVTTYADAGASRIMWEMEFAGISTAELVSLQSLYAQCQGPLLPFTFIDPTDNMLVSSVDLRKAPWGIAAGCGLIPNVSDPFGGTGAFSVVNGSQSPAGVGQTLQVPSNYQYCLSVYVRSSNDASVTLQLAAASTLHVQTFAAGTTWSRLVLSGRLNDPGTAVTASLMVTPGGLLQVFGPQLEAQCGASSYKATTARGGVYATCYLTNVELVVTAVAPGVFDTQCGVESSL